MVGGMVVRQVVYPRKKKTFGWRTPARCGYHFLLCLADGIWHWCSIFLDASARHSLLCLRLSAAALLHRGLPFFLACSTQSQLFTPLLLFYVLLPNRPASCLLPYFLSSQPHSLLAHDPFLCWGMRLGFVAARSLILPSTAISMHQRKLAPLHP